MSGLPKPIRYQEDCDAILLQTQILMKQYSDMYHYVYSNRDYVENSKIAQNGKTDTVGNIVSRNDTYPPSRLADDVVSQTRHALLALDTAVSAMQRAFAWDAVKIGSIDPDETPIADRLVGIDGMERLKKYQAKRKQT